MFTCKDGNVRFAFRIHKISNTYEKTFKSELQHGSLGFTATELATVKDSFQEVKDRFAMRRCNQAKLKFLVSLHG